jgi:hypothetical protein
LASAFDKAAPPVLSESLRPLQVLFTDDVFWTQFRQTVFWISVSFRVLFVLEFIGRYFLVLKHFQPLKNILEIIDLAIIVVGIPFKFVFSNRVTLVVNFIMVLRLIRIQILLHSYRSSVYDDSNEKISAYESTVANMMRISDERVNQLETQLKLARAKLDFMLGYYFIKK